ncbi:VOC family protein [Streptomyces sp. NPDC015130]|uniref:VOC family protein n=1 Tax=Streptomyces sp. NPDC015130 TaxID=3364940 RepID=UPI0036F65053
MNVVATQLSLTVQDVSASSRFFATHLGFREVESAEGYVCLRRDDTSVEIALSARDPELPPQDRRGQGPADVAVTLTVTDVTAEYARLRREGVAPAAGIRREPWGERSFRLVDPNGVVVRIAAWTPPAGAPEAYGHSEINATIEA